MAHTADTVIKHARVVKAEGIISGGLAIEGEKIVAVAESCRAVREPMMEVACDSDVITDRPRRSALLQDDDRVFGSGGDYQSKSQEGRLACWS